MMRIAMVGLMGLLLSPAVLADDEPLPINARLVEVHNAGIMMGLEAAGLSRLVSNCVWRVYLTVTPEAAEVVELEAQPVPKDIEEWEARLRDAQRNLPAWIAECRRLLGER